MTTIIQVEGLSKHFGVIKAVDGLSFSVNEGDVYGFLGQNGAGKSTAIRMLLTLIEPTAGSIGIFGMDLRKHRSHILRRVGAVIERPDLYGYLTAWENISLFARISGIKPSIQKIRSQLELLGLADRAQSKVKTFSQGMKQRLGIAVALIHDPALLILDEPTNGLDPQGIADLRKLIMDLSHKEGKTILISSHLLSEVELIANRMLIIDRGKKMMEGYVKELFDPAQTLIELETLNPAFTLDIINQSKWKLFLGQHEQGRFVFKMNKADIPLFTADLVTKKVAVLRIQPRHSLEDYFLSLTNPEPHVATIAD